VGAEHFHELARERASVGDGRRVAHVRGEHLELCEWTVDAGEPQATALDQYVECFVVPLAGSVELAAGERAWALGSGELALLRDTCGPLRLRGADCRLLVVGWRRAPEESASTSAILTAEPERYRFSEALEPSAPGWRFFSIDGARLTVGCSYREAPPPARERPHSHDGEQINVPVEGRFAFTVGGHTETIAPGWAALTPRGVLHTGLHVEFPYFQLVFATPPRGREYAEFLRSIYRAETATA
jgi:hypothetical protein